MNWKSERYHILNRSLGYCFAISVLFLVTGCAFNISQDDDAEIPAGYSSLEDLVTADDKHLPEREREVQDWVASCMKTAGFEYVAWSPDSIEELTSETLTPLVDEFEFGTNESTAAEDPNSTIYDSLPVGQQSLYFERLWGVSDLDEDASPSGDVDEVGCYNAAWVQVFGTEAVEARWTLHDESANLKQRIYSDPDYIAQEQAWVSCMASKGFNASDPIRIDSFIRDEIEELGTSTQLSDTDYHSLRIFEKAVRSADDECDDDLQATVDRLRTSFEAEFLRDSPGLSDSIELIANDITQRGEQ